MTKIPSKEGIIEALIMQVQLDLPPPPRAIVKGNKNTEYNGQFVT